MGKKILIIGNGFDLTHGLPTRYSDFLNFIELIQKLNKPGYGKRAFDDWAGNVQILGMLQDSRKTGNAVLQLKEYLQDNIRERITLSSRSFCIELGRRMIYSILNGAERLKAYIEGARICGQEILIQAT